MAKIIGRADECPEDLHDVIVDKAMKYDDPKIHIGHMKAYCTDEQEVQNALTLAAKWGVKVVFATVVIAMIAGPFMAWLGPVA
jgi:hypothetical protein